jgi:predicted transcriptional regulator
VGLDDSLASILALSYENGFSQFPVVDHSRFCGLVTENEIVRWLGRSTKAQRTNINLNEVPVSAVIREKDPFLRDVAVFCFARRDTPVEDVLGKFAKLRALEVVLLTPNGRSKSGIEGVLTQWDAARFPAVQNHDES